MVEEDIEEYFDVMVYQEESVDVDVDEENNQSFEGLWQMQIFVK